MKNRNPSPRSARDIREMGVFIDAGSGVDRQMQNPPLNAEPDA
jgi:hypothetical protein